MAKKGQPNYDEIVTYLRGLGIDANKIKREGLDETGYEEYLTYDNGRPQYSNRLQINTVRREWPTDDAYRTVMHLWAGGTLADLPEEEAPKKDPEPPAPAKPEDKQKEPATSKPAARKGATK